MGDSPEEFFPCGGQTFYMCTTASGKSLSPFFYFRDYLFSIVCVLREGASHLAERGGSLEGGLGLEGEVVG